MAAGMPAPAQIRASGGGIASPLWRQILADVLDAQIATVNTTEGAACGAALLAAVGAGWHPDVESAVAALVVATPSTDPARTSSAMASCTPSTATCIRPSCRRSIEPSPRPRRRSGCLAGASAALGCRRLRQTSTTDESRPEPAVCCARREYGRICASGAQNRPIRPEIRQLCSSDARRPRPRRGSRRARPRLRPGSGPSPRW